MGFERPGRARVQRTDISEERGKSWDRLRGPLPQSRAQDVRVEGQAPRPQGLDDHTVVGRVEHAPGLPVRRSSTARTVVSLGTPQRERQPCGSWRKRGIGI